MQEITIDPSLALEIVREDNETIAYDTETSGLDVTSKVVGFVITNSDYSIYVPVAHTGGGNILGADEFTRELAVAFDQRGRYGFRTVGHNLGFDLRISARAGVWLRSPIEDTMINELLIDDRTRGYGLDDSCIRRGVTPKKGDAVYQHLANLFGGIPDKNQMQHFHRLAGDDPVGVDYAAGDGISTLELWRAQQPILDNNQLRKAWKLECELMPYLARMHNRGIRVDMELGEELMRKGGTLDAQIEEAKSVFPIGFNSRSSKQVEELYRANGYKDHDFALSATGKLSFTANWLQNNDIGRAIIHVRQLEKCRDSFIKPLVETNNVDGRVYPVLHQSKSDDFGVAGSRLSCSGPNLQAQPKRNKTIGKLVRPLVLPDLDVIEEADFKQQEPRFFAHYSKCQKLIDGYRSGTVDIHDIAAHELGLPRDVAKRLGLGMLTGMGIKALSGHMGWTYEKAQRAYKAFLTNAFPEIGDFQRIAKGKMIERGYVKSVLGRRAYMESEKLAYVAVSRIIQNSGGEHMKTALLRANQYEDAYPDDVRIMLSIHDSTIWQRREGFDNTELIRIIENVVYEPDFNLLVPIPVDVGSGRNWSEASYGK